MNEVARRKLIDALVACVDRVGAETASFAYESWSAPDERLLRDAFAKILDSKERAWTTEKPTKPGFYWFLPIGKSTPCVYRITEDLKVAWFLISVDEIEGKWSGPLEPPT